MKYPITLTAMLFSIMPMAAMAQSDPQEAKKIFDQMCAGCHGYRGDGGEGHRGGFSPHIGTLADKEYMKQVRRERGFGVGSISPVSPSGALVELLVGIA